MEIIHLIEIGCIKPGLPELFFLAALCTIIIIYSVLAITCLFYTENRCNHTPIALAVFRTKLFRTLQSRETHIRVGGLWGGRDWEEMAFFGALAKGDVSSIVLASREFLPKSCLLIKYSPLCNL